MSSQWSGVKRTFLSLVSVRMWEGCDFFAWLRLLISNRFAIHWSYWPIACVFTIVSFFHTLLRYLQERLYGNRLRRTLIHEAPLFIIGHWRTGTSFLHELLALDERHAYPTTYECFEPNHFLLTEGFVTRWLGFIIPARRPMDDMPIGWERPQEDEFALCMMGQPSLYLTIAFPNHAPQCQEYLDLEGLSPQALACWKEAFLAFLRQITFKNPKRLVLKSPPHTCRIKILLEMFPDARFVHIVRNPYVVFPSTVNMWKALYQAHGLQRPTFAGLEEYVFHTFSRLYEKLEEGRRLIDPTRFYELRYEDLVRNPLGQMRGLYDHLGLGGFDNVQPRLVRYLANTSGYQPNSYDLSPELRSKITRSLGWVIHKYGYAEE